MRTATRRHAIRTSALLGATLLAGLVLLTPASAQTQGSDTRDDDQIVLHGRLIVPEGSIVGTAVIFDGPALVEGTVDEALVVFHGDAVISGTVRRDVVVFDGDVTVRSGAEIGGNLVTRTDPTIEDGATVRGGQQRLGGRMDLAEIGFASRIAWWIGYSASTLVLGLLLLLFAPSLDRAIASAARDRTGASIGVGIAWFFLLPIAAVVLVATVVAIPLGIFLLLALALLTTVGYVAGVHAIGRLLVKAPASRYLAFLVGWGGARLLGLIPVVGGLLWVVLAIFGLGALAVAARRTTPPVSTTLPPAPPMPVA